MGFRTGAYAKVWDVKGVKDTRTDVRISISRRDKDSGEYIDDFSGYVFFIGKAAASKATKLNRGDRIKLNDIDVSTQYNKDTHTSFVSYKVFDFEPAPFAQSGGREAQPAQVTSAPEPDPNSLMEEDDDLPWQ